MRKLLLSLTIAFAMFFAFMFTLPAVAGRVDALEAAHEVNFSGLWTIEEIDPDVWCAVFELSFDTGSLQTLDITIPYYPLSIQTYEGIESTFILMGGIGTIIDADLDAYIGVGMTDTIEMTFLDSPSVVTSGVNNTDDGILSANYVYIRVMFNTPTQPHLMTVIWWRANGPAIGVTVDYYVFFFDRGTLLGVTNLSAVLSGDFPGDPTPPASYTFSGWRTRTGTVAYTGGGEPIDFEIAPDDVLNDAAYGLYIPLYSFFLIDSTSTEVVPDPDPETVAAFIRIPLSDIGLDNEVGYFLIYVIVCVLLVLGIVAIAHLAWSFVLMAIFIWTVGATWLGIIPFWATAIIGIFCIGFLFKSISGSSEGSMEP